MVLWLKPWESRSLPGLPRTKVFPLYVSRSNKTPLSFGRAAFLFVRQGFVGGKRCFDRTFS
jgi:hypothetical protein